MIRRIRMFAVCLGLILAVSSGWSQTAAPEPAVKPVAPETRHDIDILSRKLDVLLMFQKLGDIAEIDEIRYTSLPGRNSNPTGLGAGNPLVIPAYTFVPKGLGNRKAPLLVFVHGGVHGRFNSVRVTRELLQQGYVIIAPEYRGSTGYGGHLYSQIDYGGAEIDDTNAARDWAVENLPNVDASRVGIIGWSHGGFHALMTVFRWPDKYQVAFAGVPVSDLVQRMAYQPDYPATFKEFLGKSVREDIAEYRRRSPVYHADKLRTPLLIHTTTNDQDVSVMEVEHLIAVLKAANKKFEYKIFDNAPGGHGFGELDTAVGRQARKEIYDFLSKRLRPEKT